LVNFRASFYEEGYALTDYVIEKFDLKKVAILYEDDAFGKGALGAAREIKEKFGIKDSDWLEVPYDRNVTKFDEQIENIFTFDPQAIGFFSTATSAREFFRQAEIAKIQQKKLFGISDLSEKDFLDFIKVRDLHFIISSVVPSPEKSSLQIVKDFRKDVENSKGVLKVESFCLEGYLAASLFIRILKKVEPPLTSAKVMEEIEKLKDYDFGGINLTFYPEIRGLLKTVWLNMGDGGDWIAKSIENVKKF